MNKPNWHHWIHYADVCAIPFFIVATRYFWNIPEKSVEEWVLFVFVLLGGLLDILFSIYFFVTL